MTSSPHSRAPRGFTLLESFIALAVLAVGMMGLLQLTAIGVRANFMGKRMAEAEELAHDLAEQVTHWDYADARLNVGSGTLGVTTLDSTTINQTPFTTSWDLGRADATAYTVQYGEKPNDTNATNANALTLGVVAYAGVSGDVAKDGSYIFSRYWNVYSFNGGKLVQIFVRWKEPGFGWREVAVSTFKTPPFLFLGQ